MRDFTQVLARVQQGEPKAAAELLPLVYQELRALAAAKMAQQPPGQTLQATALVHEAWVKLAGNPQTSWHDRQHFFRAAAEAMRQILIDRARAKLRGKRAGRTLHLNLDEVDLATDAKPEALLLVEEALQDLAREHPAKAELVKFRFYLGLSIKETAQTLGVSEKTIKRRWLHTRAWLFRSITQLMNRESGTD